MNLSTIRSLVSEDFDAVDALILKELASEVELINTIVEHILRAGGKRLRPMLLLLVAQALDYSHKHPRDNEHHELAAIIEFIHTSTLLHDDVVDDSSLRRQQPTANAVWGNAASVLAGDFLYSRAFQILARRSNIPVMKVLANTTNKIAEGEVLQLMHRGKTILTEADYWNIIASKTAYLYAAACEIGAMISDPEQSSTAARYGMHLGLAFQLIDDALDYNGDPAVTGKPIGEDWVEGKLTLPLIYTLQHSSIADREYMEQALVHHRREDLEGIIQIIQQYQGCEHTVHCAHNQAEQAKKALQEWPASNDRNALLQLCDFVVLRRY